MNGGSQKFDVGHYLSEHWQIAIAAGALFFSAIGLVFNFTLFMLNGFNYLDFATIDDFLVAGFKSPVTFLYALIAIVAVFLLPQFTRLGHIRGMFYKVVAIAILIFSIIGVVLIVPGTFAYLVVQREIGSDSAFGAVFGASNYSRIKYYIVEGRNRKNINIYGQLMTEAGEFFLVRTNQESLLLRKDTVLEVATVRFGSR